MDSTGKIDSQQFRIFAVMTHSPSLSSAMQRVLSNRTFMLSSLGTLVLIACTQIRIPLPFTPVPITGQTFAVLAWPLLFGYRIGVASVASYLVLGALGAPVFAGFESLAALWGPTSGYLIGFAISAVVMGRLRDAGFTSSILGLTSTLIVGQAIILLCGSAALSTFVGTQNAIAMGITPFLAGDIIKTILLVTMIRSLQWNAAK
ncbi:MAG: biotin transporter BioY [Candidatus Kapabacteria bacterium]|nr:biotin transporter BioY [Candidatus Kapabacteria bacterium]